MPQVSTAPISNQVVPVFGSYVFGPNDTYASIQPGAVFGAVNKGGLIISLPGPQVAVPGSPVTGLVDKSNVLPSNGDYYAVSDPSGAILPASPGPEQLLTVWGGGYRLYDPFDQTLRTQITCDVTFAGLEFTFDDAAQMWIVCCCGPIANPT
jgi:hypothetical protein